MRGETDHYEFICAAAMDGLMNVAIDNGICLGTAVLTVDTLAQAVARSHETGANKGSEAAVRLPQANRACPIAQPMSIRPRTISRLAAVQALYQAEQGAVSPETVIDQFVRHRIGGSRPWRHERGKAG